MGRWFAVLFVAIALASPTTATATFIQPDDFGDVFPHNLTQYLSLPGKSYGFLFNTARTPVAVISPNKVELVVIYNGVDDEKWPYRKILSLILGKTCSIKNSTFSEQLIDQTYKSKSLTPPLNLGGNGGTKVLQRQSATQNGCQVTVERDGARWHKLTTTITPAK